MDKRLSITLDATWREGTLTYNDFTLEYKSELPLQIPRYELDTSVRIELDDKPTLSGIYLPDIDFSPTRFIHADYGEPVSALQGRARCDWIDSETGDRDYSWDETEWAKTGWTLIRRVEGEFIDVPPEGFFPEGKPEELYNWPQREKKILQEERERITCWSGAFAPFSGRWATIINGATQYTHTRTGQVMLEFEDKQGKKHRACWSLLKRDDDGNVFIIPDLMR
ncbi:hypothetical protein Ent638_2908 [Enterobacter sp. 638]|uniref:Uncharacterized protein n=1 Tax=Enterobacter sp. (strain 638) TaxID=399742 RepID=A0A9J9KZ70_ENT38|nr:hypothetical protein Ent638_2908 [Enterobacter sp. 638]